LGRNITQRFLILDGVGGASKGAFVLVINGIIGPQNVYELRTNVLGERFEIGRMLGRTLLVGSDVKANFLSHKGAHRIKSLVGGDPLEAELKGSNQRFTVYGNFNLLINSNARLHIWLEGDRSAWERRLTIANYAKPFSGQRIADVDRYILAREAPGVLNWLVEGFQKLLQDYESCGDILLSKTQKERVDTLLSESDSLRIFVRDGIIKTQPAANGVRDSLTTEEIIESYTDDCSNVKRWVPIAAARAESQLPDLMGEFFGVTKSHSLTRNGRARRGYWNVRFV
jgi:putative DNA primase/helicase